MKQVDILLESEGDAWLARNRDQLGKRDPVSELIDECHLMPVRVLEIGCANGWRLAKLREKYRCGVAGIDPSSAAVEEARGSGLGGVFVGTADDLPFSTTFDLVICGFFIYFADPSDYLKIAAEADRVLADGGHLIVHDFVSPRPFKRRYAFDDRIFSHHFDPVNLWLGHPAYKRIADRFSARNYECASLLEKDLKSAFPLESEAAP